MSNENNEKRPQVWSAKKTKWELEELGRKMKVENEKLRLEISSLEGHILRMEIDLGWSKPSHAKHLPACPLCKNHVTWSKNVDKWQACGCTFDTKDLYVHGATRPFDCYSSKEWLTYVRAVNRALQEIKLDKQLEKLGISKEDVYPKK